jgi:hypothetical protein
MKNWPALRRAAGFLENLPAHYGIDSNGVAGTYLSQEPPEDACFFFIELHAHECPTASS